MQSSQDGQQVVNSFHSTHPELAGAAPLSWRQSFAGLTRVPGGLGSWSLIVRSMCLEQNTRMSKFRGHVPVGT